MDVRDTKVRYKQKKASKDEEAHELNVNKANAKCYEINIRKRRTNLGN